MSQSNADRQRRYRARRAILDRAPRTWQVLDDVIVFRRPTGEITVVSLDGKTLR